MGDSHSHQQRSPRRSTSSSNGIHSYHHQQHMALASAAHNSFQSGGFNSTTCGGMGGTGIGGC